MNFPEFGMGEQRVDGYLLLEQIGQGGMATVYRARSEDSERPVALKLGAALNAARLERFRREGEITASLTHPNIVRVHASGVHKDRPYIVYQFVAGAQTLADTLPEWPLRRRIEALRDVARALGYAHRRGVVHRDVKPENVLVAPDGSILLADFGLATAESLDRMTQSGVMLGTPLYMAPELAKTAGKSLCPQSDVYSLGVMLYEALTDEHPYREGGLAAILDPRQRSFSSPAERAHNVPLGLSKTCMRALARTPEQRFPSGIELAAALEAWLEGRDDPARASRGKALAGLLLVGGLVGGGLAFLKPPAATPTPAPSESVSLGPSATPTATLSPAARSALSKLQEILAGPALNDPSVRVQLVVLKGQLSAQDPEAEAAANLVVAFLLDKGCDWGGWGLPCLEALAATGARPSRASRAMTICEITWGARTLSSEEEFGVRELKRVFLALLALDVDIEGVGQIYDGPIPSVESASSVQEGYLRLQARLHRSTPRDPSPVHAQFVQVGRSPELGPVARARALSEGLLSIPDGEARIALAEEARRLDSQSATVRLAWAHAILWAGEKERGWTELCLAWEAWRNQNRGRQGAYIVEGRRLNLSLRLLLRNDMLKEAEELLKISLQDPQFLPDKAAGRAKLLSHLRSGRRGVRIKAWLKRGGGLWSEVLAARKKRKK